MRDQHLGRAIAQDVARFLRREMPVDRHRVGTEPTRRHIDFEGGEVVAQHQRHAVVLADTEGGEPAGSASDAGLDLGPGAEPFACGDAGYHFASFDFFFAADAPITISAPWKLLS